MTKIVIASQNAHKIAEIAPVLAAAGFAVTDGRSHELPEPEEDASSFIGNARIKAKAAVQATGMAALADDSGLVVEALHDFPGVESAPYAKTCGGYPQAVADLFTRLKGRSAACYYICVLLVLFPDGREVTVTGKVHGHLIQEARGAGNFGYDPWFVLQNTDKTFAEISPEEKNRLSHRGLALQDLLRRLKEMR